jgi:RNA polymerase sigma-70 factor (ECF subfamily)
MDKLEQQWIRAYRAGDVQALERLVEQYRRPLFAFILKMTSNPLEAEEVFQEVWFRAINKFGNYKDHQFLSWLFRIARNLVIDQARKRKPVVDLHNPGEGEDPYQARVADTQLGPDVDAASQDLGQRIRDAVNTLPQDQKEVFIMRTEGEISFKEIAKIQHTSINTALARMQYALAKLRPILQSDYEELARS